MTEVSIYIHHKGLSWSERISKVKFKKSRKMSLQMSWRPKSTPATAGRDTLMSQAVQRSGQGMNQRRGSKHDGKRRNDEGNCWHLAALTFSEVRTVGLWQIPKLVCSFCLSKMTQGTWARTTHQRLSHLMQRQMLEGKKYKSQLQVCAVTVFLGTVKSINSQFLSSISLWTKPRSQEWQPIFFKHLKQG